MPPGRCGHTLTPDPDGKLWLFGGTSGGKEKVDLKKEANASLRIRMLERRNVFNDIWVFDPVTDRWQVFHFCVQSQCFSFS